MRISRYAFMNWDNIRMGEAVKNTNKIAPDFPLKKKILFNSLERFVLLLYPWSCRRPGDNVLADKLYNNLINARSSLLLFCPHAPGGAFLVNLSQIDELFIKLSLSHRGISGESSSRPDQSKS